MSHKLPDNDLKKYFGEVFPEYDHDRVYNSDIRKVLHWYNILHKLNLLVKEEEEKEKKEEETGAETKTVAKVKDTTKEKKAPAVKKAKVAPDKTTVRKKASKSE